MSQENVPNPALPGKEAEPLAPSAVPAMGDPARPALARDGASVSSPPDGDIAPSAPEIDAALFARAAEAPLLDEPEETPSASSGDELPVAPWRRLLPYAIALVIGTAIATGLAYARGFSPRQAAHLNAACWSDGLFVAGFMQASLGALMWVATTGFFDILSYGVKSLLVLFSPLKNPSEHKKFYDYKTERAEHRSKPRYTLLITGGFFLLLSGLCLYLYYALA